MREALVTVVAKVVVVTGWGDCFVAVTCGHLVGTALSVVRRPLTEASSKRQRWSAGRPQCDCENISSPGSVSAPIVTRNEPLNEDSRPRLRLVSFSPSWSRKDKHAEESLDADRPRGLDPVV